MIYDKNVPRAGIEDSPTMMLQSWASPSKEYAAALL